MVVMHVSNSNDEAGLRGGSVGGDGDGVSGCSDGEMVVICGDDCVTVW